jgi:hypothetical protein
MGRQMDRLTTGGRFEWVALILSAALTAGAYFDAWTYVSTPSGVSLAAPWQDAAVHLSWGALTGWLSLALVWNLGRGVSFSRALPAGYDLSLAGCLAFGVFALADYYWGLASHPGPGLSGLLEPPRLLEIVSASLIVTAALRSGWMRGDSEASPKLIISAALLLSTMTFLTQFVHPFRDPWAGQPQPPGITWWVAQDFGLTGIVFQACLLLAFMLTLMRRFVIKPGSLTLLTVINGVLVSSLKGRFPMIAVALAAGATGDLIIFRLQPSALRIRAMRLFGFVVPAVFAGSLWLVLLATGGTWWPAHLWVGSILVTGLIGWLVTYLVFPPPRNVISGRYLLYDATDARSEHGEHPAHDPQVTPLLVKGALESLNDPAALAHSPLLKLQFLSRHETQALDELRSLLLDIVKEVAASSSARDAESGRLLLDYYVRRAGSHDVIAERLHLSRPTFYRRLQRGLVVVAERLDELIESSPGAL